MLSWLKVLNDHKVQTVGDILFVATVGEEELGNLRGVKKIFADHLDIDGMVGLEPGSDGQVYVLGVGSHRYEVTFKSPGGHSYIAFGVVPSAIHAMGRAIAKIAEIRTPTSPKTTFTVGTVGGGTSVNTIAPDARMAIDIRSEEREPLLETEKKIFAAIDEAVAEENKRWNVTSLTVSTKLIGDRPSGRTPSDSVIVEAAVRSNTAFGHRTLLHGGSADANVPMSLGIPAIIAQRRRQGRWLSRAKRMDRPHRCMERRAELARHRARPGRRAGRERTAAAQASAAREVSPRRAGPQRLLKSLGSLRVQRVNACLKFAASL